MAYRCSLPISMGLSMPDRLQASSQSLSYGQIRAQHPPKMLFSRIVSAAPFAFLKRMERMKRPGSVPAGQPTLQGASWQSRQRAASSIAVRCVNPACVSEV
jgi:hypothetical protein